MSWHEFWSISYLFSPLLVGLATHGFSIKFGWLGSLTRPIDGGKAYRGKRIFGENKTYRGVFAVALGTALGFGIQTFVLHRFEAVERLELLEYWAGTVGLGFLIGAAAMLSELLNSFVKRQLGIAPGTTTKGLLSGFFYVLDQIDLLIGAWFVLAFLVSVTVWRVVFSAVFLFFSHQVISLIGYALGMRKTAR